MQVHEICGILLNKNVNENANLAIRPYYSKTKRVPRAADSKNENQQ